MTPNATRRPAAGAGDRWQSCLYRGTVRHRRFWPAPHSFRYSLYLLYLDLAELPQLFDGHWLWSARGPNLAWFRRRDFLGGRDRPLLPLEDAVRNLVEERTGERPHGPIRLLTQIRHFGLVMNPVSFYYCFDAAGTQVVATVAEITNTPWGERHCYVLPTGGPTRRWQCFRFRKRFHVSPFMSMEHDYDWRFSAPGQRLFVHMVNHDRSVSRLPSDTLPAPPSRCFDATLALRRQPLSASSLAAALASHPAMSAQVGLGIYWQALRLWLKGAPFHTHPRKRGQHVPAPVTR